KQGGGVSDTLVPEERQPAEDDASSASSTVGKTGALAEDNDAKPSTTTSDRHISIQTKLEGLEVLTDLNGAGRKACPLCPEEKFKACYSHKLRRHLQNLHWKVYVEFEGTIITIQRLYCLLQYACAQTHTHTEELVLFSSHLLSL
uniref:Uncharacterized protein n=1 Tax=Hucho hucho TaxID=62062 RepID=A0A4W5QEN2_9TELE